MSISSRSRFVRTTIALPAAVLEEIDAAVRAGNARSRNQLLADAAERELQRLRNEAIDRKILEMANDPELLREQETVMAEFRESDAESSRALDRRDGGASE